jgi:hypothetical protein
MCVGGGVGGGVGGDSVLVVMAYHLARQPQGKSQNIS